MQNIFPVHLAIINVNAVDPVSLERLQNEILRKSLEQLRQESSMQKEIMRNNTAQIEKLTQIVQRRTSHWTPAKAISYDASHPSSSEVNCVSRQLSFQLDPNSSIATESGLGTPAVIDPDTRAVEDTGVYIASDNSLRGFIVPSPPLLTSPRPRTEVDLVLPPTFAFCAPGMSGLYSMSIYTLSDISLLIGDDLLLDHPVLGCGSVHWNTVFAKIKQPGPLWNTWKPSKTLDRMSIQDVWDCYNVGEGVEENGKQTGVKPPLRLVEQKFGSEWRKAGKVSFYFSFFAYLSTDVTLLESKGLATVP